MPLSGEILVALSGGVDSAVSALKLSQMGFKIVGVIFKLWEFSSDGVRRNNSSHSNERILAAKKLCENLNCKFIVEDVAEQFHSEIVKNFTDEYRNGRTPNPCVICNPRIKWSNLTALADKLAIEKVATGHYARTFRRSDDRYNLLRGADTRKDQSYFLYRLTQEYLARTVFPVGHLRKEQVRTIADNFGLPLSSPRESQELCFLPDGNIKSFMRKFIPDATERGPIFDSANNRIGTHNGIAFYTIGQREGLGGGYSQKMYVLDIIPSENAIVIGGENELWKTKFLMSDINWIQKIDRKFDCTVRIRHFHKDSPAIIEPNGDSAIVEFEKPQRAITCGQSAVFYDELKVIGGGIIDKIMC